MYVCVCVMFQCFLSKYFYQGCVCVMFQDVSTRGMSSFCISDCFYPGTVDVLCFRMDLPRVLDRGVVSECLYQSSVGVLYFRMFLPEE